MPSTPDRTKVHQGPGTIWLGVAIPALGARLTIDSNGNPTEAGTILPPAAPVLSSVSGGTLGAATYYAKITYLNGSGETTPSPEGTIAIAADNWLVVQSPPPMANATGYNVYASTTGGAEILQNAGPIGIGANWTQSSALATTGAAPPTQNTSGPLYGGAVLGATTLNISPKINEIKADQVMGVFDVRPVDAASEIEVTLLETDLVKLSFLFPGAVYSSGTDATLPPGLQSYEQITYGGLFQIPTLSMAVISPRMNAPGKFVVSQLYNGYISKPPSLAFSKEKPTEAKVTLAGLAVTTRPAGDQIGTIWRQL